MDHVSQKMSEKLLISACLLGQPVRYDGKSKPVSELNWLKQLEQEQRLVVICPEVAGGLPTPRPPAEKMESKVVTESGIEVTKAFQDGAKRALELCQEHGIRFALLKAKSPSCGNSQIYDGSFSGTLTEGMGVTAELLSANDIQVFSELELEQLKALLC